MFISGFHCQVLLPHGLLNGLLRWLTYKARFSQQALTMVTCSFQNLLLFKLMRETIHVNILIKKNIHLLLILKTFRAQEIYLWRIFVHGKTKM